MERETADALCLTLREYERDLLKLCELVGDCLETQSTSLRKVADDLIRWAARLDLGEGDGLEVQGLGLLRILSELLDASKSPDRGWLKDLEGRIKERFQSLVSEMSRSANWSDRMHRMPVADAVAEGLLPGIECGAVFLHVKSDRMYVFKGWTIDATRQVYAAMYSPADDNDVTYFRDQREFLEPGRFERVG